MFYGCHRLNELNLSFFDSIIKKNKFSLMFGYDKLIKIEIDENSIVKFIKE